MRSTMALAVSVRRLSWSISSHFVAVHLEVCTAAKNRKKTLRARCTNVIQLWTRVKSEFEPSSAINCIAPMRFKRWPPFNSEPPSDHQSNFDLGSTRGYTCALDDECSPGYYCCKNCPIRILSCPKNFFVSNNKTSNAIILMIWIC